jgi:3-isopropylmalate dehydrogenase
VTSDSRRSYRVGVIPGDGIGPEVIQEGLKVLNAVSQRFGFTCEIVEYPWNSALFLRSGELMPEAVLDEYRTLDALYLGALGDPRVEPGLVERSVIMTIRLGLDLYINLRPIILYAEHLCPLKEVKIGDVDMVVVRENTEDAYVGLGGIFKKGTPDETAIAEMIYTRRGVERCVRYAFQAAQQRPRRRLTLVDKSNAIRPQDIWRRTLAEVATEYPEVSADAIYVDAAAMYMVAQPARFDVMVTTNLFGDILTDLGAVLQGGMGSAASGNIHPGQVSMFEPIHGSAPDIAGQNAASPIGAIAALAMLLENVGEAEAAATIQTAIRNLLTSRRVPGLDARTGLTTADVGNLVVTELELPAEASNQRA